MPPVRANCMFDNYPEIFLYDALSLVGCEISFMVSDTWFFDSNTRLELKILFFIWETPTLFVTFVGKPLYI